MIMTVIFMQVAALARQLRTAVDVQSIKARLQCAPQAAPWNNAHWFQYDTVSHCSTGCLQCQASLRTLCTLAPQ